MCALHVTLMRFLFSRDMSPPFYKLFSPGERKLEFFCFFQQFDWKKNGDDMSFSYVCDIDIYVMS